MIEEKNNKPRKIIIHNRANVESKYITEYISSPLNVFFKHKNTLAEKFEFDNGIVTKIRQSKVSIIIAIEWKPTRKLPDEDKVVGDIDDFLEGYYEDIGF